MQPSVAVFENSCLGNSSILFNDLLLTHFSTKGMKVEHCVKHELLNFYFCVIPHNHTNAYDCFWCPLAKQVASLGF